jgi:two-component system, sensor histidine kinase and response regulator
MKKMIAFCTYIWDKLSHTGTQERFEDYEIRRIIVFNRLNAVGFAFALSGLIYSASFSTWNGNVLNLLPKLIACFVFVFSYYLMYKQKYQTAIFLNFFLIPLLMAIQALCIHEGSLVLYILIYCVLPFFYLNSPFKILAAYLYTTFCYLLALYFLENHYPVGKMSLQVAGLLFLYFALHSMKIQAWTYENLLKKSRTILNEKNNELSKLLELKTKILAVISHDVRTPIIGIKHISNYMMEHTYKPEELSKLLPEMIQEITKTSDLFDNLLEWAKIQFDETNAIKMESITLSSVVQDTLQQVEHNAAKKNIHINNTVDNDISANANHRNLQVVVRNLLTNAVKFTPNGGSIYISAGDKGDWVNLYVKNTGSGIHPEKINKIFGAELYTTKGTNNERGIGLGLKICKDLVHQNKGELSCESLVGVETTFIIKLPIGSLDN